MGHIPAGTRSKRGTNNSASVVVGKKTEAQDEETTRNEFEIQTIRGPLSPQCTETPLLYNPGSSMHLHTTCDILGLLLLPLHVRKKNAHTSATQTSRHIHCSRQLPSTKKSSDPHGNLAASVTLFFFLHSSMVLLFFFVLTNLPAPPLMLMNLNKELNQICGRNTRNCQKNERRLHTICDDDNSSNGCTACFGQRFWSNDETHENTLPSLPLLTAVPLCC